MEYKELIYTIENQVATITLNRPERMNALTKTLYSEMEHALRASEDNDGVRAIIITGAGRGFCSGDDVKSMAAPDTQEQQVRKTAIKGKPTPVVPVFMAMNKPLIAAVNGAAVGWGMDLSLFCDIRIASELAKFGEVYVLRGLIPDISGFYLLPRIIGLSRAYELLLTGDVIDAKEAERIGLVSKVVPPDQLMPTAKALAAKMAALPPLAVKMSKEAVRKGLNYDLGALGEYHAYALGILFQTEDFKEGSTSLLERRRPIFKGR